MSPILQVTDLIKSFGGLQVTKKVNLSVNPGERRLLIGPNGAGKTTLFNLISGDLVSDSGRIILEGRDITKFPTAKRAQLDLARTYQILTLFGKDNLISNIKLALLGKIPLRWKCWGSFLSDSTLDQSGLAILDKVGLESKAYLPLEQTSYGEKRRLEIAMALAQNPKILLLDEPLAGLSTEERETITVLLKQIDRNITILMIEHDMEAALAFADRVTLLHYGEVITSGTRQEVVNDPRTKEIYLGH